MSLHYEYFAREQPKRIGVKIVCPKCHQTGSATWGVETQMGVEGPMFELLNVSDGFYQRVAKVDRGAIETVCGRCGFLLV